ncbi:YceK/YidQ family lipoprotein [Phocoenobacter uteri]|uniref:YceK/YidQ family lipoprotein n=1 Tax=Phocoenobacter uteri TaxID=146806 RepID=UPI000E1BB7EA|nr:YceK/YidQ family lipoprotein [Phocoenobacter uteri]MDG6882228.1 hypothetical protein [Phocoenobacter uteri]
MTKFIKKIIFAIFLLNLTAYGTVVSITQNNLSPYSGTKNDLELLQQGSLFSILATIDLPLSIVFDTLLLPVSFSQSNE